jgi:hypothetical protein
MEKNELMIGDIVFHENYGNAIIESIDNDFGDSPSVKLVSENIKHKDGYKYGYCWCDLDEIFPIPLTPEILEKNGFHVNGMPNSIASVKGIDDWSDDTYVWSRQETPDERMFVSVYMDDPANFFVEVYCQYCHADGIHVKYLHELQHALKLCGIEKNIII